MSEKREEVEKNYRAFQALLPGILAQHRDKYALMRHEKIVNYYSTMEDAYVTAVQFYPDGLFSIQKVTDVPVDLGYFSHAVPLRPV
jgi:hypothetical protein